MRRSATPPACERIGTCEPCLSSHFSRTVRPYRERHLKASSGFKRRSDALWKDPDAREPAVQLHDPAHAAAALAVDQVDGLPDAGMTGPVHDETHRGPDA